MFPKYLLFRKLVKPHHLICFLFSFRVQGKKESTCQKRIFAKSIQGKDIKFINKKEVILKTGTQGSFSHKI
jgi:hypothetical protein